MKFKEIAKLVIFFLVLNFSALAIGGLFAGSGAASDWYQNLQKAPWTPPGWVFGAAWTLIMITFSWYMAYLIHSKETRQKIIVLFSIQWVLNVLWNPLFFHYHNALLGMICISILTILIAYFFIYYLKPLGVKSLLIAPYLVWLIIATSLNGYILLYN